MTRELNPDVLPNLQRLYDSAMAQGDRLTALGLGHDRYSGAAYRIATDIGMIVEALTVPGPAERAPRELLAPIKARAWRALLRNPWLRLVIGGSVSV